MESVNDMAEAVLEGSLDRVDDTEAVIESPAWLDSTAAEGTADEDAVAVGTMV
jgi:hypothetical protein